MVQEGVDLNKRVKNSNSFLKGRFKMMLCFMESSQKEDRNFSDSSVNSFFSFTGGFQQRLNAHFKEHI